MKIKYKKNWDSLKENLCSIMLPYSSRNRGESAQFMQFLLGDACLCIPRRRVLIFRAPLKNPFSS
ncbi:MAG: hypothetical protein B0D92_06225 [Spirochaeta sp. LUC14_002_19_P3]|nr:MAG: hypothetical protein B0D92_06225 [Spirochaeta sp. LUC14_002_19_P3]